MMVRNRNVFALLALILCGCFWACREPVRLVQYPELDAGEFSYRDQNFVAVELDPTQVKLELFWQDPGGSRMGSFSRLRGHLEERGKQLLFATNAGIFSSDFTPGGLHIENGQEISPLNLKEGEGNFHLMPNGVFAMGESGPLILESNAYSEAELSPDLATQSGPMLVIDGKLHPAFNEGSPNKYIRNGVGINDSGKVVFAISRRPVNFHDFASLFRDALKCKNALYLDGAISQFYLPPLDMEPLSGDYVGMLAISRNMGTEPAGADTQAP